MSPLVAALAGGASTTASAAAEAGRPDGAAAPVSLATPFASATGPPDSAPQSLMGFSIQQQQPQQEQQHKQQQPQQQSMAPVPQSSPFAALAQAPQPQLTASSSLEQLLAGQCTAMYLACIVLCHRTAGHANFANCSAADTKHAPRHTDHTNAVFHKPSQVPAGPRSHSSKACSRLLRHPAVGSRGSSPCRLPCLRTAPHSWALLAKGCRGPRQVRQRLPSSSYSSSSSASAWTPCSRCD